MGKIREMRRIESNRFSFAKKQRIKQSVEGFNGTDEDKSKRRLSEARQMASDSDREEEDEHPLTNNKRKRFKLSKKFFDEYSNVDHACVPRKLRTAMKKRDSESVSLPSPDMKKVKHMVNGNLSSRKNNIKKSKLNPQTDEPESSLKQVSIGPITKDEEEVVETLFSLAEMFSNNDKLDCKLSVAKSSLPLAENSAPTIEGIKESDLQTNDSPRLEGSALDNVEFQSVNGLPQADNLIELDNEVPGEKTISDFAGPSTSKHDESSTTSELKLMERVPAYRSRLEKQPTIMEESKSCGSALWPGLSTMSSVRAEMCSAANKLPPWLDNTPLASSSMNLVLNEKDCVVETEKLNSLKKKNKWKTCSAHVYISRLIKVLQITEGKDDSHKVEITESKQKEVLAAKNNAVLLHNKIDGGLNGVVSDPEKRSNDVRNAILLHKSLVHDQNQKQLPTKSGLYDSHKQGFNFMSVSSGEYGVEGVGASNRAVAANGLESATQFHAPYLHSIAQNHANLPQNRAYSSPSFPRHFSSATAQQVQQIQLPPYLCSPFTGPSGMENIVMSSEQQQLHRLWTTQQAIQYRTSDVIDPTHLPILQNQRHGDSSSSSSPSQYAQSVFPPVSCSSLGLVGPNSATTISPQHHHHQQHQHQQFNSLMPPPSRGKRQHHFLSGYQGKGAPPVQITLQ